MQDRGLQDRLLGFYEGSGTDDRGRRLDHIWGWDHGRLESVHDYIQWVFPTEQRSSVNPTAPLVTHDVRKAFADSADLRGRLRRSLAVMLDFYGLALEDTPEGPSVLRAPHYDQRRRFWQTAGNHNYLRITRILTSLRLLGLQEESRALLRCLVDIYESGGSRGIGRDAYEFWLGAAE